MEEDLKFLSYLKHQLLMTPFAKENQPGTHVLVRCPICGDSRKHQESTHCYINIEYGKPISYYCFLCNTGKWINSDFLSLLGIKLDIWEYNKRFMNKSGIVSSKYIIHGTKNALIPEYVDESKKINYIINRLGLDNFNYLDFKVILSLKRFLEINNFKPNLKDFLIDKIDSDYVGFLSMDNSYIIFRDITGKNKYRYINYPVFSSSNECGSKLYVIPGKYDLMADDIECNITEGIFDILGCYFNINNQNKINKLYVAVNGSGYMNVIKKVLKIGFINNLNVKIYSDLDKDKSYYKPLFEFSDIIKSLQIYYNDYPNEKDIGVSSDRIRIKKVNYGF